MDTTNTHRFDPVDLEQMRLLSRLSPGQRIQVMLDARELAVGLIRGRLRRQYPHLSPREINLKVLEEIARAERTPSRS
jgi:phage terminase Nu1 subunit (DNA packaging protein)